MRDWSNDSPAALMEAYARGFGGAGLEMEARLREHVVYREALEKLLRFGEGLMNSEIEDERGIGCCVCEGARVVVPSEGEGRQ